MDDDLINLIKNSISNDYCKLTCIGAIEEKNEIYRQIYIYDLMVYSVIYGMDYIIENIHKEELKYNFLNSKDKMDFIYLYYLENNNKEDIELKNKIVDKYKRKNKKISKEIKTLKLINFDRKIMKYNHRKCQDEVIKKSSEVRQRLSIIADCMKYKLLIKYLKLENNEKLDRILNWNILRVKKINTIDDKIWLM